MIKLSEQEIENAPDFMPVVGYEVLYEVGKEGSVWSLNYKRSGERKQLSPVPDKDGYLRVDLWKDGKRKNCKVHQLVLSAYLPKPSENLEVLHINSEVADNRLDNLAWGYHVENNNDPHRIALMTNHPDLSVLVLCVETGEVFPSAREASRQTGVHRGHISSCYNGKRKTAGGYHWQKLE